MIPRKVLLALGAATSIGFSYAAGAVELNTGKVFDMKAASESHTEVKRISLGQKDGVDIMAIFYQENGVADGHSLAKRSVQPDGSDSDNATQAKSSATPRSNQTLIDLSTAKCTSVHCYPGSFQPPERQDCDAIAAQQLSQSLSENKLTAFPGTFVLVYHRTCAVVFQNPSFNSNYALQYKWSLLGNVILELEGRCFQSQAMSIGGACRYKKYKDYEFQNVLISLQRIIEPPASKDPPRA